MLDFNEQKIIDFLSNSEAHSSKEIFEKINFGVSYATVKRILTKQVNENYLVKIGEGKATKYQISPLYKTIVPLDLDNYFKNEVDERKINEYFNFDILTSVLNKYPLFSKVEEEKLYALHSIYTKNINQLSPLEYKIELERLSIDLSWKSSEIEGNTYSLLETERLLKDKETAAGKTKEEAIMLLNHKEALDFIIENRDYLNKISIATIENIHKLLVGELGIPLNLRKRRVGISGTNYRPLDNEFQILEALELTCDIINQKPYVFEKALLALLLISYIQPFIDGNKRTARIVSNAILINHNYCPLSFRTVDSLEYKKAMLIFYEQNNLHAFKEIFINQYEFAVNTYF